VRRLDERCTHLALLRGINVGGKKMLPMRDLTALFEQAGCENVRTYIQSGNVPFEATPATAERFANGVASQIEARFGFRVPMMLRSAAEMSAAISGNPFVQEGADENALHVGFLRDAPNAQQVRQLAPDRSPPDRFAVKGREIYLHLPNGMGRTKLTNDYFDRRLGTVSTVRNWRTVMKLSELMGCR